MKIFSVILFLLSITACNKADKQRLESKKQKTYTLVIHGGAGNITKENLSNERWLLYQEGLKIALDSGYAILESGHHALGAVTRAISILEDNPLFNAGKGSVYNIHGKQEMDASIMDGSTLNSGAVAGVNNIKNPIIAAHWVMYGSQHAILSGNGAKQFAIENGLEIVDSTYFYTKRRYDYWKSLKDKEKLRLDHDKLSFEDETSIWEHKKYGTVGAVALDQYGNIVAGTSTGGLTNKQYGRIGDSPIVGAGTYANNKTCGVSCTGTGEYFIRTLAAHEVSSLVQYKNMPIQEATDSVIYGRISTLGGDGGMIALDRYGNVAYSFNTSGMFRAFKRSDGTTKIEAFK